MGLPPDTAGERATQLLTVKAALLEPNMPPE